MSETVFSDGCVFCPAGVVCADGPSETRCGRCGWNPRIAEARKEQAREKLRRGAFAPPKVPIEKRFDALRREVLREYYLTHRGRQYCGRDADKRAAESPWPGPYEGR